MKKRWVFGIATVMVLVAATLGALRLVGAQGNDMGAVEPADAVVTAFYSWYLDYSGEVAARENPLVDGAYRESPYLDKGFVNEVDALLESFRDGTVRGGFDPFLLAQDVPVSFGIGESRISGTQATVTLDLYWGGNPEPTRRMVTLELVKGRWLITGVGMEA